jgi:hypothetical protein
VLLQIINTIQHKESKHQTKQVRQLQQEKESTQALTALFGIGLGLLMLGTLSSKN